MDNTPLSKITTCGQSIWMDYLDRSLIESGELKEKIETRNLRGLTSNPSIFEKAISGNEIYDSDIQAGADADKSPQEIYESLAIADIQNACDIFRAVYDESDGQDGFVSLEVSPYLARDLQGTIAEARRLYRAVDRPNVMIKIPGTLEGFGAIEQCIAEGINVNVTLLFSVENYKQAAWAYLRGLETRVQNGQSIDGVASVASFFVSRIDSKVDKLLDERLQQIGTENLSEEARLQELKGKVAIANAKVAYREYQKVLESDRWKSLEAKGAKPQRLLWGSTSTKNPDYSDVLYVEELVASNTVNTLPPDTIEACFDHCKPQANRIESNVEKAYQTLESLRDRDINIDLDRVMEELLDEGIDKFVQPYQSLLDTLEEKSKQLMPA
ncbi:transaldolase [Leptolyngbya valderiana BDU 20041]|nr:transaldolase [Leptolyngbya valderiana BDU 20041]PPT11057.1 Transaldolase [Geitlerinema sp. FC II]